MKRFGKAKVSCNIANSFRAGCDSGVACPSLLADNGRMGEKLRRHRVMLDGRELYAGAQWTHVQRFAEALRARGQDAVAIRDETPRPPRQPRPRMAGLPPRATPASTQG